MVHGFKVATTLAAYRCVRISAAHTVAYPSAANLLCVGITQNTVKDTTNSIPVAGPGELSLLEFHDSVTAASLVQSHTDGRGILFTPGANTTSGATVTVAYIGVLKGPAVDLTGTLAEVYIMPGFGRAGG